MAADVESLEPRLPRTAADVVRFDGREAVLIGGIILFHRALGLWRYPAPRQADLERMSIVDKAYWVHKARHPISRAARGSSLEEHFASQALHSWALPPDLQVEKTISVTAVGDLMGHPFLSRSANTLYRDVADLVFDSDLAMANLEQVVHHEAQTGLEIHLSSGPRLCLSPAELEVLTRHEGRKYGFVATACNHSLDHGAEGVDATIAALRDRGIALHGTNMVDSDAVHATLVERQGVRVALVAFTLALNARRPPAERPGIVNRMRLDGTAGDVDLALLRAQLASARAARVDFVIAHLHWGFENELYPRPEQVDIAHLLAEEGVDAIVGHHPHVPQPAEWYRTRRDRARVVPIFYSLGNLTTPLSAPPQCRSSVARIELARGRWTDGLTRTYVARATTTDVEQIVNPGDRTITLRRVAQGRSTATA